MPITTHSKAGSRYSASTTKPDAGENLVLTLDNEVTASLYVGKSEHKTVQLPAGKYDLVSYSECTEYAGSDYCWVTFYTTALIRATNGNTDRIYEVKVSQGGDKPKFNHGKIVTEKVGA